MYVNTITKFACVIIASTAIKALILIGEMESIGDGLFIALCVILPSIALFSLGYLLSREPLDEVDCVQYDYIRR